MRIAFGFSFVIAILLAAGLAQAKPPEHWQHLQLKPNPYEGWTLKQIMADPGFHPFSGDEEGRGYVAVERIVPSLARQSAAIGAPYSHHWIGYISLPDDYLGVDSFVVFDNTGAGITMVPGTEVMYDDPVPLWFAGTLDYFIQLGILEDGYV